MVKLTGGTLRGRTLQVPPGNWVRPTMGRVRESLFSMLGQRLIGARVLDLYAGCGLLGMEAISRGAKCAIFVDSNPKAVAAIQHNIQYCRIQSQALVYKGSVLHSNRIIRVKQLLNQLVPHEDSSKLAFDLIFMDPPYKQKMVPDTLHGVRQSNLMATGGLVVAEQEVLAPLDVGEYWQTLQNRQYGDTRILFWQACLSSEHLVKPIPLEKI